MGLKDWAYHLPNEMSGGQKQRVHIGRAMAQNADVLLLDEPISSLDLKHQIEVLDLIRKLAKTRGITVIMALHDLNLAIRYSDNLALMKEGVIYAMGNPQQILNSEIIQAIYSVETEVVTDSMGNPFIIPLRAM